MLGQQCSKVEVSTLEKTGKCSPELLVLLLNYVYNNDLFTDIPTYPYFVMMK
jgi:hypothetical protein